jgi:cytochrome P450 family 135
MHIAAINRSEEEVAGEPRSLHELPRASAADLVLGLGRFFRPGTRRSRLHRLGERFVVDGRGLPTILVTTSPQDAKAILANSDAFSFGEVLARFTPHDVLFGSDTFIFLEGDDHIQERRKLSPPFHGQALHGYEDEMVRITERRLAQWPINEPAAFLDLGYRLALDVMRSVIFGVSDPDRTARLETAMLTYCDVTQSAGFIAASVLGLLAGGRSIPYPPLQRAADAVDAIVLEEIAQRRRTPDSQRNDCLTLFLEINAADQHPKDDATIARGMRGLMLAGYETTAITIAWIGELLAHHPKTLTELHRRLDDSDHTYLDAVIAEVMRQRPSIPATGRRALQDTTVNGIRVPTGTYVVVSVIGLHERDDIYPHPLTFSPQRFLDTRPGTYTWLTFGGGPHRCLGGPFALFEARTLISTILQHHTIQPASGPPAKPRITHPMLIPDNRATITLLPRIQR